MMIDAHLHLPVGFPDLFAQKQALLDELKRSGAAGGIVIADSSLESVIGSVKDCIELFKGDSVIKVIAGISPLIAFEAQLKYCEELLAGRDIVGLKIYTGHEHFYCTDARLLPVYELAERFRVPVLFHTGWDEPQYASPEVMRELAVKHPNNTFVYCHCFYPQTDKCFAILGDCENVCFDTSSIADDPEKLPDIKASIERAIMRMPQRFLFGSDFGSCSQKAHIDFAKSLDIPDAQRELFMYRNAQKVYRLS